MNQDTFFPMEADVALASAEKILGCKVSVRIRRLSDDELDQVMKEMSKIAADAEDNQSDALKSIRMFLESVIVGWDGLKADFTGDNVKEMVSTMPPNVITEIIQALIRFCTTGMVEAEETSGEEISSPSLPT
jgi:hypothetical protein